MWIVQPGPNSHIAGGVLREAFVGSTIRLDGELSRDFAVNPEQSQNTLLFEWTCQSIDSNAFCSDLMATGMVVVFRIKKVEFVFKVLLN